MFGGVAILVGAFTIFNTLSITVAQRTRELGLLRMVGAARRQVLGSVLVEALAIGVLASRRRPRAPGFGLAKGARRAVRRDGPRPAGGRARCSPRARSSSRCSSARSSRCSPACCRRGGRRASPPVAALRAADAGRRPRAAPGARRAGARRRCSAARRRRVGGSAGGLARRNAMRQPGRTIGDRRGADDRRRAGDARHRRRRGPEGHDARRARATGIAAATWSPAPTAGRRPTRPSREALADAGVGVTGDPPGPRRSRSATRRRSTRSTRRRGCRVRLGRGRRRACRRRSAPTARSSTRAGRRSTASRVGDRVHAHLGERATSSR